MITGRTVETLRRQVPNYHLLAAGIARTSHTVCPCRGCAHAKDSERLGHLVCGRVAGRIDDGLAIVAVNGTCDRAEWRRETGDLKLSETND